MIKMAKFAYLYVQIFSIQVPKSGKETVSPSAFKNLQFILILSTSVSPLENKAGNKRFYDKVGLIN